MIPSALLSVYSAKLCGMPLSLLSKFMVTCAPAGTVSSLWLKAKFLAYRSIVTSGPGTVVCVDVGDPVGSVWWGVSGSDAWVAGVVSGWGVGGPWPVVHPAIATAAVTARIKITILIPSLINGYRTGENKIVITKISLKTGLIPILC